MEQKIKFIIAGLVAMLAVSLFLTTRILTSREALDRERANLKKENAMLEATIDKGRRENKRLEEMVGSLNKDLDKISKEKQEVHAKYEAIEKEKQQLAEQLESLKKAQATQIPAQADTSYWSGILKVKKDLEVQLENVRVELNIAQVKNEDLERNKGMLELDIKNLNRETQDLKQQVGYNQKIIDGLGRDLEREKSNKAHIQETLRFVKNENRIVRQQLKALSDRKSALEEKLIQLQKRTGSQEVGLGEPQAPSTGVVLTKSDSIELPPIIVRPQSQVAIAAPVPTVSGKILSINKENNFVIIDLGQESGIQVGSFLKAYQNDKPVATLSVIQVRSAISACDIKNSTSEIKVGDVVK